MQSTGQASTQAGSLVPIQGSAITYAISVFSQVPIHNTSGRGNTIHQLRTALRCTKLEFMPAKVRKAVFPAAGWGTRFLPATKAEPNEMLPLVDKPVIQYAVEEAVAAGIEQVIIVTSSQKRAIEDHFDISVELEQLLEARGDIEMLRQIRAISDLAQISYVRQKEQLGLGHAVLMAKELVGHEPFAVILSDDVVVGERHCIGQLIHAYQKTHASVVAVMEVPHEDTS